MTQGHSAVFPFLKLWKKTFSPLPSSHFEWTQRNNMNCKMFFLTLSFATDKSNRWAKKCQQYRDEGWWFQGRSEVFRQNFPAGPGCFHHMYRNSQASLRLRSSAPCSQPASSPIVLHILLSHSHQPRFHRPYCLPLNSLTSFNPEFTKLLKLYVSEQNRKRGFAANISLSLISSELQPSSWVSFHYRLVLQNMKYNKSKEMSSTPVPKPPYFSNTTKNFCMTPCTGRREGAAHQWEPQQSSLVYEHHVNFCACKPSSSPRFWWEAAHFKERMCTLLAALQKQTELPTKEASGSQWGCHCDPVCACFGCLPCPVLQGKSCVPFIVVETW